MNYKKIIFLFFIVSLSTEAQLTTGWQNYSSMNNVSSAVVTSDGIWAGTEGGAFYYNFKDSTYKTFTKTEGMNGSPITAVAKDSSGNIWFGSQNGKIDVYNPTTKIFKNIFDVYNSERTEKKINAIAVYGDTAFVSTSFGLSIINTTTLSFYDTFFKLGNFASNIEVNYSYKKDNIIYAATSSGIAVQKAGTTNLVAPESWNTFTTIDGLSSNTIYKIDAYHDTIFISSPKGFSIFTANTWQQILPSFANNVITDFIVTNGSLYFLTDGKVYSYTNSTVSPFISQQYIGATKILAVRNNEIMLASNFGIVFNYGDGETNISPNGPKANIFFDMAVDQKSNLWVATGKDIGGVGFFKYNGSSWKTFDVTSAPLLSNAFHAVSIGSDNSVYFANWGSGFVRVKNDSTIQSFSINNTPLIGMTAYPDFLVIGDMKTDSKDNLWILNHDPADKIVLSILTPDSTWYRFKNTPDPDIIQYILLAIDQYDTKWFVSEASTKKSGLYYFNEKSTISDTATSDDRAGYVSGLNSNSVFALALDKRGELWVGTNSGVNVISNPDAILTSSSSALKITSVFSLRQQAINCLAVDAINRKWVGTNQGLIVAATDGSSLLATFDSKNSPLLSDQIKSLTIDEKNGIVYAAVDGGLTAFYTTALAPNTTFSSIETSPSPFLIGKNSSLLTIDGLIKDSDIKILSIAGNLIQEFSSPGGKIAFWDGRNNEGKFVNTGIYLIVAYDKEGNSVATGKIAIIRQ
ncbi:MAG: hypothetical protein M0P61_01675 [Ignavibacteriaceae bacterium]|jgi:hypothetical protein|nr:hypothetical protein [Ignavibacteriaceae bacterium]